MANTIDSNLLGLIAKLKRGGAIEGDAEASDAGPQPTVQPVAGPQAQVVPRVLDPQAQMEARQMFGNDPTATGLRERLFAQVQGGSGIELSKRVPTDEEAQAGLMNRNVPMSARHIHEALKSLGLPVGADPNRIDDPTTKESIKQLKSQGGFPANGDMDLDAMMAIVEAMMAKDRGSKPAPRRSSGAGGGGGGGGGGTSGAGGGGGGGGGGTSGAGGGGGGGGPGGAGSTPGGATTPGGPLTQVAPVNTNGWRPGAGDVTPEQLRQIVPTLTAAKAAEVAPHLNIAMREANIDTPEKKAAFIAQVAHESGGFRYNEEIASGRAYEGRRDLGNTQPGDGERFKGRGYIQLTGRANYEAAGRALGLDLVNQPELASRPENASRVAAWYWNSRGLNSRADGSQAGFDQITYRVNGGYNGKADRDQYFARALQAGLDNGAPSTGTLADATRNPNAANA